MIVQEYYMLILWFLKFYKILNYVHKHWKKNHEKTISDNPIFSHFFTYLSRDHRAMSQVGPKMTYVPKYKQNETFLVHQRSHFAILWYRTRIRLPTNVTSLGIAENSDVWTVSQIWENLDNPRISQKNLFKFLMACFSAKFQEETVG